MKPVAILVRFLALGVGLLALVAALAMEVGLGGLPFYLQLTAALAAIGTALAFTAFAHSPMGLILAILDIPGTIPRTPEELERSARVFRTLSRLTRACGWIGVLMGVISMFQNLSDPKHIGMGMSLAMVSALYGHFFSAALCIPCREILLERAADARNPGVAPSRGMG